MANLLRAVFESKGAPCELPVSLPPGTAAAVVLANWRDNLLPLLRKTFSVTLSGDELALLVGGDADTLEQLLTVLETRAKGVLPKPATRGAARKFASYFNSDFVATIVLIINQLSLIYSAVIGALLSVFVPQLCPPTSYDPQVHVCSLKENFTDLTVLNQAVLGVNFGTLFLLLASQLFFALREKWTIEAFDYDEKLPADNLTEEIELYPTFKLTLTRLNAACYAVAVALALLVTFNFIFSAAFVMTHYYDHKTSVTGLASALLLIAPRVISWLMWTRRAYTTGVPVSLFAKKPAVPNTIDGDYRFAPNVYQPRFAPAEDAAQGGSRMERLDEEQAPRGATPVQGRAQEEVWYIPWAGRQTPAPWATPSGSTHQPTQGENRSSSLILLTRPEGGGDGCCAWVFLCVFAYDDKYAMTTLRARPLTLSAHQASSSSLAPHSLLACGVTSGVGHSVVSPAVACAARSAARTAASSWACAVVTTRSRPSSDFANALCFRARSDAELSLLLLAQCSGSGCCAVA